MDARLLEEKRKHPQSDVYWCVTLYTPVPLDEAWRKKSLEEESEEILGSDLSDKFRFEDLWEAERFLAEQKSKGRNGYLGMVIEG